jgi:hypothetical protein
MSTVVIVELLILLSLLKLINRHQITILQQNKVM